MFCPKCGVETVNDAEFCSRCGQRLPKANDLSNVVVSDNKVVKNVVSVSDSFKASHDNPPIPSGTETVSTTDKTFWSDFKSGILKLVGILGSVAFVAAIIWQFFPNEVMNVFMPGAEVRTAHLSKYSSTVTIEDAFDAFFANEKWSTYKEKGYKYVAFSGSCKYLDKDSDVRITFKITGANFVVDGLEINGQSQNDLILAGLLTKVYENYEKGSQDENGSDVQSTSIDDNSGAQARVATVTPKSDQNITQEVTNSGLSQNNQNEFGLIFENRSDYVYAMGDTNIRNGSSLEADKVGRTFEGQKFYRTGYNPEWTRVEYEGNTVYIVTSRIMENVPTNALNSTSNGLSQQQKNQYASINYGSGYILIGSDYRYLDKSELYGLSADECKKARNEIFARHGRKFKDKELQSYFDSQSWYYPYYEPSEFNDECLNEYEKANIDLLKTYENNGCPNYNYSSFDRSYRSVQFAEEWGDGVLWAYLDYNDTHAGYLTICGGGGDAYTISDIADTRYYFDETGELTCAYKNLFFSEKDDLTGRMYESSTGRNVGTYYISYEWDDLYGLSHFYLNIKYEGKDEWKIPEAEYSSQI